MSPCPICGSVVPDGFCAYHLKVEDDAWAEGNRVLCDLLHRGQAPARVSRHERDLITEEALP